MAFRAGGWLLHPDGRRLRSGIINQGGTILRSARSLEYKTPEGFARAVENLHHAGIEGLVVIGGNGSQRGQL